MIYEVTIKFNDAGMPDLTGIFYVIMINEKNEMLYLYRPLKDGTIEKYSIPMNAISEISILPSYEDNGQKISCC